VFCKRRTLEFPLTFRERIAVLESGFRMKRGMREFDSSEWDAADLEAFGPAVIVAPLHTALSMADQKLRGMLRLPSLRLALVILTRIDDEPLADHHRDLLWRAFGLPVFEQLRNSEGIVIARECEVHDGLHLTTSIAVIEIPGEVVTGQCECGADTPRIRSLVPQAGKAQAAAA